MKEICDRVSAQFAKEFTKVLSTEGGHQVVKDAGEGRGVGRGGEPGNQHR